MKQLIDQLINSKVNSASLPLEVVLYLVSSQRLRCGPTDRDQDYWCEGFQKTLQALEKKWLLLQSAMNFQREKIAGGGSAASQESNGIDTCSLYHSHEKVCDVSCGLLIQFYYPKEINSAKSMRQE